MQQATMGISRGNIQLHSKSPRERGLLRSGNASIAIHIEEPALAWYTQVALPCISLGSGVCQRVSSVEGLGRQG
jgi:hypothetical protein